MSPELVLLSGYRCNEAGTLCSLVPLGSPDCLSADQGLGVVEGETNQAINVVLSPSSRT